MVHQRTEQAKAFRREHGDGGGAVQRLFALAFTQPLEQHHKHSNERQPFMRRVFIAASRGRDPNNPSDRKHPSNGTFRQRLEINWGGYSNTITSVGKDNNVICIYE